MLVKIQTTARRKKEAMPKPEEWPPLWTRLPSMAELERLSQPGGAPVQRGLFAAEQPDDTRQVRLARILDIVPNVTTAINMKGVYPT